MLHGWTARTARESVERILAIVDNAPEAALENLTELTERLRCSAAGAVRADHNDDAEAFSLLLSANAELAPGNLEAAKAFLILALKELAKTAGDKVE